MYRMMLVDDEPEFRKWFLSEFKHSRDFQVVGDAVSAEEALSKLSALSPDLVIADVYLPGQDGFEIARYIKNHYPAVKVILISACEDHVYERLTRDEGALTFIPKTKLSLESLRQALPVAKQP